MEGAAEWRYAVFSIGTMLKEAAPWPGDEIAVSLDPMERTYKFDGSTTYLLFLQGVDLACYPRPILRPEAVLPLTEDGAVKTGRGAARLWPVMQEAADPGFFADPEAAVLASDGISGAPLHPCILVPQKYPDLSSMTREADLILLAQLENPVSCLFDAQRCAVDPNRQVLADKSSGQEPPTYIMIPFVPERGTEYVVFLRELEPGEFDLCAREGAVLKKTEIANWDEFVDSAASAARQGASTLRDRPANVKSGPTAGHPAVGPLFLDVGNPAMAPVLAYFSSIMLSFHIGSFSTPSRSATVAAMFANPNPSEDLTV